MGGGGGGGGVRKRMEGLARNPGSLGLQHVRSVFNQHQVLLSRLSKVSALGITG